MSTGPIGASVAAVRDLRSKDIAMQPCPSLQPAHGPQDMPRTAAGTVQSALIRGDQAVFEVSVQDAAVTELAVQRVFADGTDELVRLDGPFGAREHRSPLPDQAAAPLQAMRVLGRIDGAWHRLETEAPRGGNLERLLSTTLEEINANLRWGKRIRDLETRFFAARNTVRALGEDIALRARCNVSVGYGAIETGNADILAWCLQEQGNLAPALAETDDFEILASLLVFWCHLAVQRQDAEMLAGISRMARGRLMMVEVPAVQTFNLLCLALLLGGWHLAHGEADAAAEFFQPSDRIFRFAVKKYPRALESYRELISVTRRTYFCQIGRVMAEGQDIPAHLNIPRLTPVVAWRQGNRLRDEGAAARLEQSYKALCRT